MAEGTKLTAEVFCQCLSNVWTEEHTTNCTPAEHWWRYGYWIYMPSCSNSGVCTRPPNRSWSGAKGFPTLFQDPLLVPPLSKGRKVHLVCAWTMRLRIQLLQNVCGLVVSACRSVSRRFHQGYLATSGWTKEINRPCLLLSSSCKLVATQKWPKCFTGVIWRPQRVLWELCSLNCWIHGHHRRGLHSGSTGKRNKYCQVSAKDMRRCIILRKIHALSKIQRASQTQKPCYSVMQCIRAAFANIFVANISAPSFGSDLRNFSVANILRRTVYWDCVTCFGEWCHIVSYEGKLPLSVISVLVSRTGYMCVWGVWMERAGCALVQLPRDWRCCLPRYAVKSRRSGKQ